MEKTDQNNIIIKEYLSLLSAQVADENLKAIMRTLETMINDVRAKRPKVKV